MSSNPVPSGFTLHTECSTSILLPADPKNPSKPKDVFINPVQEYNRDLSVAAIRCWADVCNEEKMQRWVKKTAARDARRQRKGKHAKGKRKVEEEASEEADGAELASSKRAKVAEATENGDAATLETSQAAPLSTPAQLTTAQSTFLPYRFTCLEALSATGLRAIRYANEIPALHWVLANDLSATAVQTIERNVAWNGLSASPENGTAGAGSEGSGAGVEPASEDPAELPETDRQVQRNMGKGKVRVSQSDASAVMYSHRGPGQLFDMIDLDPYGTAAPFLDGAVQAIADGGLLAVTCTDLAVLAGGNYPEKSFANYGGVPVRVEYSHEMALRLVLHAISTSASRYGRYIVPLLSLSIDFYVRLFVRVYAGQQEAKRAYTNTGLVYACTWCGAPYPQPFGRVEERGNKSGVGTFDVFHNAQGPPAGLSSTCSECGGRFHVAGPMWLGPLHDRAFVGKVVQHVADSGHPPLKTAPRIRGMLSIAASELDAPFFFTPSKIARTFHCVSPPLTTVASALLNAGYKVSRSHCVAGSLKTDAPREVVHDVFRKWIESNPVKLDNIKEGNPARVALAKERKADIDLAPHPDVDSIMLTDAKIVRYQQNPEANWGPKQRARA